MTGTATVVIAMHLKLKVRERGREGREEENFYSFSSGNSCPVCGECYLDNDFDSKVKG